MLEVADNASCLSAAWSPLHAPQPGCTAAPMRALPAGYIHLGVAKEIAPTLRDFGIDPDPVIREAGLDPRLFEDGGQRDLARGSGPTARRPALLG